MYKIKKNPMKIKIIFQKIGNFFLTLIVWAFVNSMASVIAYFFVMFLWAMVGDDNQQKIMTEVGYGAGIAIFVLMSIMEILWYAYHAYID